MGEKLGGMLGDVADVGIFEMPDKKGAMVKSLVVMKMDKPLVRGVNAGRRKYAVFWVDFRFEKLP